PEQTARMMEMMPPAGEIDVAVSIPVITGTQNRKADSAIEEFLHRADLVAARRPDWRIGVGCGDDPVAAMDAAGLAAERFGPDRVFAKPSAGLPVDRDRKRCYPFGPRAWAALLSKLPRALYALGGCCGCGPEWIQAINKE
ncbi:hypothetical protein GF324_10855, partial [bacterium]|nr:hypothetical protein [bacterium]